MLVPFLCSLTGIGCNFGLIWVSSLSKSTILAIALNYMGSLRQILAMRWNCQRRYVPARSHSQAQSHSVWFCVIVHNGLFILALVTKRTSDPSNPTCLPRSPYQVHGILWNRRRGTFTLDLFLEHSHYSNSILNYTDDRSNHIQLPVFSLADSLNLVELPTRQGHSHSHSHDTLKSLKISRIARGYESPIGESFFSPGFPPVRCQIKTEGTFFYVWLGVHVITNPQTFPRTGSSAD